VVFSNSVLFQAAPLFKQIPGTSYGWHEVVVSLAAGADPEQAEHKLLEAVKSVYEKYRHIIERQQQTVERLLETAEVDTSPKAQLLFTENGLEFMVRYPVEIQRGSAIDDQMTRKLIEVIAGDPTLKTAVAGMPKLRSAIKA
jgi:23S rRNA G2069 N7-methylase RlmK/C1962 C5-methylase RlmI